MQDTCAGRMAPQVSNLLFTFVHSSTVHICAQFYAMCPVLKDNLTSSQPLAVHLSYAASSGVMWKFRFAVGQTQHKMVLHSAAHAMCHDPSKITASSSANITISLTTPGTRNKPAVCLVTQRRTLGNCKTMCACNGYLRTTSTCKYVYNSVAAHVRLDGDVQLQRQSNWLLLGTYYLKSRSVS